MLSSIANAAEGDVREHARATIEQVDRLTQRRGVHEARLAVASRIGKTEEKSSKQRRVSDAMHLLTLPGKIVLEEGGPSSRDAEVNEAYDGCGVTYDFYQNILGRNSIDGKGLRLDSTVHYGVKFDNAMWDGGQMIYGDGDGTLFNRFTSSVDVIGHELTHGVTQYSAALGYSGQSGALNEHISDAFGIMVKQYSLNQVARESDWLIGAGLLAKGVKGKAIRSMSAPGTAYDDPRLGKDPQPSHMRNYAKTHADNGGVHINSGIPNRAFYLAATTVGGFTWTAIGRTWYQTLTTRVRTKTNFAQFAKGTVVVAGELYGIGSNIQTTIASSWSQVGIAVPRDLTVPPSRRNTPPPFAPPAVFVSPQRSLDH